jgi:zinc/manganese transport system substrate-binding protein
MTIMKQAHVLLTFATVALVSPLTARAELRVVTTTSDLADLARQVGGARVTVESLCKGNQDPHYVQARPSYMVTLSRADLVIAAGLELEVGWLPALLQGARNPDVMPGGPGYLDAGRAITPIDVPRGAIDRSQGDVHALGNPHYWLDPERAKSVAAAITRKLGELDPSGRASFDGNLKALQQRLDAALQRWTATLKPHRGAKVVSYHRTFDYFFARFGLQALGYIEDRPGIPPAPAHVAQLIAAMRAAGVRVIFHESYFDRATSDVIAKRTGARVLVLPTSVGGAEKASSYERLIDLLVTSFVSAMRAPGPAP